MTGPVEGVGKVVGGGLLAAVTLLAAEVYLAGHRAYLSPSGAPAADGTYGPPGAPPLRLALLGDSTAAGVGASDRAGTVGAQLGEQLAAEGRRVEVHNVSVSGSRIADLNPQVSRALLDRPDLAVILIGANDGIHLTSLAAVRTGLAAVVRRLRAAGVAVVVGSCPDLGSADAFLQPLRALTGWRGRQVARVQREATVTAGGHIVDIGARTGAAFRTDPSTLSTDRFHPSSAGYRLWTAALVPEVRAAAGVPQHS